MTYRPLEQARDLGDLIKTIENIREQLTDIHNANRDQTPLWTIYGPGTSDHPGLFVMRLFLTTTIGPTNVLVRSASLDQLRELLPIGLYCLPRQPNDDVNIIECWI